MDKKEIRNGESRAGMSLSIPSVEYIPYVDNANYECNLHLLSSLHSLHSTCSSPSAVLAGRQIQSKASLCDSEVPYVHR